MNRRKLGGKTKGRRLDPKRMKTHHHHIDIKLARSYPTTLFSSHSKAWGTNAPVHV
jgi:hypothetical protein